MCTDLHSKAANIINSTIWVIKKLHFTMKTLIRAPKAHLHSRPWKKNSHSVSNSTTYSTSRAIKKYFNDAFRKYSLCFSPINLCIMGVIFLSSIKTEQENKREWEKEWHKNLEAQLSRKRYTAALICIQLTRMWVISHLNVN